jgi:hypothetical protein
MSSKKTISIKSKMTTVAATPSTIASVIKGALPTGTSFSTGNYGKLFVASNAGGYFYWLIIFTMIEMAVIGYGICCMKHEQKFGAYVAPYKGGFRGKSKQSD